MALPHLGLDGRGGEIAQYGRAQVREFLGKARSRIGEFPNVDMQRESDNPRDRRMRRSDMPARILDDGAAGLNIHNMLTRRAAKWPIPWSKSTARWPRKSLQESRRSKACFRCGRSGDRGGLKRSVIFLPDDASRGSTAHSRQGIDGCCMMLGTWNGRCSPEAPRAMTRDCRRRHMGASVAYS